MSRIVPARRGAVIPTKRQSLKQVEPTEVKRSALKAYEEVVDFIARQNPREVIAFRPSQEAHDRLDDLLDREETSSLSGEERSELDHYLQLEHILRMAKARARQYLASPSIR